jgi:hypothetical protein
MYCRLNGKGWGWVPNFGLFPSDKRTWADDPGRPGRADGLLLFRRRDWFFWFWIRGSSSEKPIIDRAAVQKRSVIAK